MSKDRLPAAALLLAVVLGLLWAAVAPRSRERSGRLFTDFEFRAEMGKILDPAQLARSLAGRLGRPFRVVEAASCSPGTVETLAGPFSLGIVHVGSCDAARKLRPLKALYWLPEPPEREVVMVRVAGRLQTASRVMTTPACATVARALLAAQGLAPEQLRVRDIHHEGIPRREDDDGRPFRWMGIFTQALLEGEFDLLVTESRRLREETFPSQQVRLRVVAAARPASQFLLVAAPEVAPELLEALRQVLPAAISGGWAVPSTDLGELRKALPLLQSRAARTFTTPPGGVPFEEALP